MPTETESWKMEKYELVIVGGGMVGLTMALALRPMLELNAKITLIDPAPEPSDTDLASPSFDDRATALSKYSFNALAALGISTLDQHSSPIKAIEVSDRGHAGYHLMEATEQGLDQFGAVIANKTLGLLLWQKAKSLNIEYRFNQRVSTIKPDARGHTLSLSNEDKIHSQFVLLCDGGRSGLHHQLGLQETITNFQAHARIAIIKAKKPHAGTAYERFTQQGPIALLPFGDYSALVWTIPNDRYEKISQFDKSQSLAWLNEQVGQRLGLIEDISDWQDYPLVEKQLPVSISHGFLALGNAAATLHPVAGQGFNLAIRGMMRSAQTLNNAYRHNQAMPSFEQCQCLASELQKDQKTTALFSNRLISLFGSPQPAIQVGRGLGLNSLDRHPLLSQSFALAGMGLLQQAPGLI
ncbi:FAD-dependent monooxygenase [Reinekea marina]|uniref:FAD-dependent monooxygenase n=1 Tax=Reinekea marina TaxID=1310421 RepID=A0ABV7WQP4_9GAMM|nr:FAD-dependent monooxygenase [Reinekea marina]MDN3650611.1 FAD-dependent monooxygenase [Reinekea marina]